jgi:hypothetical protein
MKSVVVRDGTEQEIPARELVPGDIVSYSLSTPLRWSGAAINFYRLLSKMVPSFQLIVELSRVTTTPTVTQNISRSSRHNVVIPSLRRKMTPTKGRNTVLVTPFSLSINLP